MKALRRTVVPSLFVLIALAAGGCSTQVEEAEVSEAEIGERLGPANAAPLLDSEEVAFVNALNAYRKAKNVNSFYGRGAPLRVSIGLVKAARKHSQEMARLGSDATHNDRGRSDQGALRNEAMKAALARIESEYPQGMWSYGETPGPSWGEDCARRADIETGAAAFALLRVNNAETLVPYDLDGDGRTERRVLRPGFGEPGLPLDGAPSPNMIAPYLGAIGVARAKAANGVWYWTVTYGSTTDPTAPMMSINDSAEHSLLANGSFEEGRDEIGKGVWSNPQRWYGRDEYADPDHPDKTDYRVLHKWHVFGGAGSVEVRADNAYFVDGAQRATAKGLRIVDSGTYESAASATQIVKAMPGVNYEVSARARRVAGTSEQTVYLDFLDATYKRLGVTTVRAGTQAAWTGDAIKVSATAPPGTVYARVILYGTANADGGSTYDWDDVRLRAW